ncbi:MgtC/SapB family protein [Fluviicola sp.]|uniref:MgtC/SapB family protein n=1 Tax=Fluviicola sp. TaxID=1917219 RepID=UPI0031CE8764
MEYEIALRFLLAALWGGIVGIEREYRSKSAGFRTIILISIGSCFFTLVSSMLGGPNPDRIAANIVTGIGFLGAGVILHGGNKINGITTAATIWTVSAVGMGIGAGYYFAAACASFFIVVILVVLPFVESKIDQLHKSVTYIVSFNRANYSVEELEATLAKYKLKYKIAKLEKDGDEHTGAWLVQGGSEKHWLFVKELNDESRVDRFNY